MHQPKGSRHTAVDPAKKSPDPADFQAIPLALHGSDQAVNHMVDFRFRHPRAQRHNPAVLDLNIAASSLQCVDSLVRHFGTLLQCLYPCAHECRTGEFSRILWQSFIGHGKFRFPCTAFRIDRALFLFQTQKSSLLLLPAAGQVENLLSCEEL